MPSTQHLVLAAAFVLCLVPAKAATFNQSVRNHPRPDTVAKISERSFSGGVQSITGDGVIKLRDDRLGDIQVVLTAETKISKNGSSAGQRNIVPGTRLHGYGSFRGGKYFAKTVTID